MSAYVRVSLLLLALGNADAMTNRYPYDMVCNNGTDYACVCYWQDQSLRGVFPDCKAFVADDKLRTTRLSLKNLDITGIMYNGERYEYYFKRRLANLITQFCESDANQCPGTALRIEQDRIVILDVECADKNETDVNFVVTQIEQMQQLYQPDTLSPLVVVQILSENKPLLEQLLGAIRITYIGTDVLRIRPDAATTTKPVDDNEQKNFGLTVFLIVVAIFFAVVYTVAIFKVISVVSIFCSQYFGCTVCPTCSTEDADSEQQVQKPQFIYTRAKRRLEKEQCLNAESQKDYGATTNHHNAPNEPTVSGVQPKTSRTNERPVIEVNQVDEPDETEVQIVPETTPLVAPRPPSPPAKAIPRYPKVSSNHFDFLPGPQLNITKSVSSRSIDKIDELPEPDLLRSNVNRSATVHEMADYLSRGPVGDDSSESDSDMDALAPTGYTVLSPAESMETLPAPPMQPVDIRIEFVDTSAYSNGVESDDEIETPAQLVEQTFNKSAECLVNEHVAPEPDKWRNIQEENSSLSGESSSSSGAEDSGLGLHSTQYHRLAESNASLTQQQPPANNTYQPIP